MEHSGKMGFFQKDTLGKQFTRAADSIAFNISEGYGRTIMQRIGTFVIIAEDLLMKLQQQ